MRPFRPLKHLIPLILWLRKESLMSVINFDPEAGQHDGKMVVPPPISKPLHRLAAVREDKRLSVRDLACRLHMTPEDIRLLELGDVDAPLSTIYEWAVALEVPVAELLVDEDAVLPFPRLTRQQALGLMQTAQVILRAAARPSTQRLAQTLINQLVEIAPELSNTRPASGKTQRKQRTKADAFVPRPLSDKFFIKPIDEH
jgi:transcriptional regulator with XRE-family HTH domain